MNEKNQRQFRLGEALETAAVQSLYAELKAAVQEGTPLVLDGSQVCRVDTASLQMLAALLSGPGSAERSVRLQAPSQVLMDTAGLLGLGATIGVQPQS